LGQRGPIDSDANVVRASRVSLSKTRFATGKYADATMRGETDLGEGASTPLYIGALVDARRSKLGWTAFAK
jgi:hypothetical protein